MYFRGQGMCKAGARTATCCSHVAAILFAAGILAYNPGVWKSRWRNFNIIDTAKPRAYTTDVLSQGMFS